MTIFNMTNVFIFSFLCFAVSGIVTAESIKAMGISNGSYILETNKVGKVEYGDKRNMKSKVIIKVTKLGKVLVINPDEPKRGAMMMGSVSGKSVKLTMDLSIMKTVFTGNLVKKDTVHGTYATDGKKDGSFKLYRDK